jgi:hypothetical protein
MVRFALSSEFNRTSMRISVLRCQVRYVDFARVACPPSFSVNIRAKGVAEDHFSERVDLKTPDGVVTADKNG